MNTHIYVLAKKSATFTIQIWLRSGYFTGLFYWPTAPKRFSVTCIGPHLTWNLQISGASHFGNFGEIGDLSLSFCIWYIKHTINLPLARGGNIRMCQAARYTCGRGRVLAHAAAVATAKTSKYTYAQRQTFCNFGFTNMISLPW